MIGFSVAFLYFALFCIKPAKGFIIQSRLRGTRLLLQEPNIAIVLSPICWGRGGDIVIAGYTDDKEPKRDVPSVCNSCLDNRERIWL